MTKRKYILVIMAVLLFACKKNSFLDKDAEIFTEDRVFADSSIAVRFLNDAYSFTGQDVFFQRANYINSGFSGSNDYGCLEDLTNLVAGGFSQPQQAYVTGINTAGDDPFNKYWGVYYTKIRALTLFLKRIGETPMQESSRARLKAEARFLRTFFYAALVRLYGGVQLMTDEVLSINDVVVSKRNTLKECVDYIVSECDQLGADANLPKAGIQPADQYGRVTRGMALALKARILLMVASPLYNGSPLTTDAAILPLVAYAPAYDASLWTRAAAAMKAVMETNEYSLVEDNTVKPGLGFKNLFLARKNSEYIFPYMRPANNELEQNRFPLSRASRPAGTILSSPTENMVQAFGMANGKAIGDPASGYSGTNPYEGRDPRFYYSIIYNQAKVFRTGFADPMQPVNSYEGGEDAIVQYGTRTGYFARKMCNDEIAAATNKDRVYPVIRYAEIILGYAEALNEQGNTEEAVAQIMLIRKRAGIEPGADGRFGISAGITKDQLRSLIQNEYQVELFMEGHRYYDVRRWKIAHITEAASLMALRITRSGTAPNFTYTYPAPTAILTTNFLTRMYFAPIPQSEINKSADLTQNPGW